ncbi:hypothetical protein UFOVP257_334 [uncultured Caudovirales phage]|uniref:Lipoprotein n=1 Tax=uncultured Caudovirales phage TaxID=2100421 RepID=A0A6J5LJ57_9CAUD|nr:hypothetical protein UFOVP257_334 [uncultured Caudovirales phage]
MKRLLVVFLILLSGCSTIDTVKKYWPRDHDPVMFDNLVTVSITIEMIDCTKPDWSRVVETANHLSRYAAWRGDPQADNLKGLLNHAERMSHGGSKMFCELGKKTATQRIEAAKTAWEKR